MDATTARETIHTITTAITTAAIDPRPIPGERPATAPLAAAGAAVEAEPFAALAQALTTCFDGDVEAALAEDAPAATTMIEQIVTEHVHAAHARLAAPTPTIDWSDHHALATVIPTIARRAADLRFVQILTA